VPEPVVIVCEKTAQGKLVPVSAWDAELFERHPVGQMFVLRPIKTRSNPLHNTYWKMLRGAVEATGDWPTPEKLHAALMWTLGFITIELDMEKKPHLVRDSIAFHRMPTDAQFRPVFDAATQQLALTTGVDPLAFLEDRR
jgi:hypothetical protein